MDNRKAAPGRLEAHRIKLLMTAICGRLACLQLCLTTGEDSTEMSQHHPDIVRCHQRHKLQRKTNAQCVIVNYRRGHYQTMSRYEKRT